MLSNSRVYSAMLYLRAGSTHPSVRSREKSQLANSEKLKVKKNNFEVLYEVQQNSVKNASSRRSSHRRNYRALTVAPPPRREAQHPRHLRRREKSISKSVTDSIGFHHIWCGMICFPFFFWGGGGGGRGAGCGPILLRRERAIFFGFFGFLSSSSTYIHIYILLVQQVMKLKHRCDRDKKQPCCLPRRINKKLLLLLDVRSYKSRVG